jgi:hypothetical protein
VKLANCTQEATVTKAARSGEWPESLRNHVETCGVCEEIVRASRWMQALASGPEMALDPRDPSLVWWRAQLAARQVKMERTRRTMEWVEIASACAILCGLVAGMAWNWRVLGGAADWLIAILSPQTWTTAYDAAISLPISVWLSILALSLVVILIGYTDLSGFLS